MRFDLPAAFLQETIAQFRRCGVGRHECQALWISPWASPQSISKVIHPAHSASPVGFRLDDDWLGMFWRNLSSDGCGVRIQVHTHPGSAYHSATDDAFPIISTPGFLSLVFPRFAMGPVDFETAFLAQIDEHGDWREVPIHQHLRIV